MIPICVQSGGLEEVYGVDGAYQMIREAGFDAVDVNLDHLLTSDAIRKGQRAPVFDAPGWEEALAYFQPWKDAAERHGLMNAQAHAPFPSYVEGGGPYNEYLLSVLETTIRGCAHIGCHRLVIHPFFNGYHEQLSPQAEWELNLASYSRLIPAAKEYGVIICLENMFTGNRGKIYSACCSDLETACRYIDALNERAGERLFGFCLDTGHFLLVGKDIRQAISQLGARIECFHIHDNNGLNDQHLAPYMGILDWNRFIQGLRDIGFDKPLSFETYNALGTFDPELAPEVLRLIARTGRLFAKRAEAR